MFGFDLINFKRFDRSSTMSGFVYENQDNSKDIENNPSAIHLDNIGFNMSIRIKNFMAEPIVLGANVRTHPTRIMPLIREGHRTRIDQRNYVIVTIYHTENLTPPSSRHKTTQVRKTEIKIPGNMLNQGSVFIEELDSYISTESNIDAMRELIARDNILESSSNSINVPTSLTRTEPTQVYHQYKHLVKMCIERQDMINIRVGYDWRYGTPPAVLKTMHIAILDHYFVPFDCNKLVFDPSLGPDEFIIENLHLTSREEMRGSFSDLARAELMYLDHEEYDTLTGKFYGMALFANQKYYSEYLFKRKAIERFNDETLYLAERSGDPRLKEQIAKLLNDQKLLQTTLTDRDSELQESRETIKKLEATIKKREEAIKAIRDRRDEHFEPDTVLQGLKNEQAKIGVDRAKIDNEAEEQQHRQKNAKMIQRAAFLKAVGDIMKSGWGIATVCVAGIASLAAVLKKYNVKISVG